MAALISALGRFLQTPQGFVCALCFVKTLGSCMAAIENDQVRLFQPVREPGQHTPQSDTSIYANRTLISPPGAVQIRGIGRFLEQLANQTLQVRLEWHGQDRMHEQVMFCAEPIASPVGCVVALLSQVVQNQDLRFNGFQVQPQVQRRGIRLANRLEEHEEHEHAS